MGTRDQATGIILFAHGSRVEEANQSVHQLAQKVEEVGPYAYVRAAFLELGHPDLPKAIREAADAGLRRVIVVPYFLTMGIHLRRDLPKLVQAAKQNHPDFELEVGHSLEGHPLMPALILSRVQEALDGSKAQQ
jgi:sirohydrochlorin ferrochelatase